MNDYRLFIYDPPTVFAARVNEPGGVEYPTSLIVWDGATVGSYTAVKPDMTVIFGSQPGWDDLGRYRVKSLTATTLQVGRLPRGTGDGQIDIEDDSYITVLDDYRVWAKIPYQSPATKIKYKDGFGITADDNVVYPPPIANGGGAVAGTIDGTGVHTVGFSGENSFAFDPATSFGIQAVTGFSWDVGDGSIISGSAIDESIVVEFPAGFRWVHLTVEIAYGEIATTFHTCHIPVFVRDPDDDESTDRFQILDHVHNRDGMVFAVRITEDYPRNSYIDGTLVMVWNGEATSQTNRDNLLFCGWIHTETQNTTSSDLGTVTDTVLNLVDVAGRLKLLPAFTQIQSYSSSPTTWDHTRFPNILYYMWYLLYWHSTAIDLADFIFISPYELSTLEFKELGSDAGDLYNQVNGVANSVSPDHHVVMTRLGQIMVAVDPNLVDERGPFSIQDTVTEQKIVSLNYTYNPVPRVQRLIAAAVIGDRTIATPRFTRVPMEGRGHGVQVLDTSNKISMSGAVFDMAEGHRYAKMNSPFSPWSMQVVFDTVTRHWEPLMHQWIFIFLPSEYLSHMETSLESHFSKLALLTSIAFNYSYQETGTVVTVNVTLEIETSGPPGELYIPPE